MSKMVDSTIKILTLVSFLVLISQGYSKCSLSNLSIYQYPTGHQLKLFPEYRVDIINNCPNCVQKNVKINCPNFETVEFVDPSIFNVSGDICLVNGGKPIVTNLNVTFNYAWSNSFVLTPNSSEISC
ncbi:TPD1 protein homolog 1B-like [Vicia villosa]|uniref:TPD1 protein homolog 1B-like n=1 Tax=Vicia villosa TaxID=3911 RepID=UPI00273ACB62|nr:TPD1 protein homolog 1B-like [Vicia villosa]